MRKRVDLSRVDFEAHDQTNSWSDEHMILGGVGVIKFMAPDGSTGFQIITTPGDLNFAEKLGMTQMLDSYMAAELDESMWGDNEP